jgi:hypothetical protein
VSVFRVFSAALSLALAGCGGALPDPTVTSLSPAEMSATVGTEVTIGLEGVMPLFVDHGSGVARVEDEVEVSFGSVPIGLARWTQERVTLTVPTLLIPGVYDVIVTLADDRRASLPGAFTVTPGEWPTGYTVDSIDDQRTGVPFDIVIRAQGPAAATFGGNVLLSVNKGNFTPDRTGAFIAGVRTETVTFLDAPGSGVVMAVTDLNGTSVNASPFRVEP